MDLWRGTALTLSQNLQNASIKFVVRCNIKYNKTQYLFKFQLISILVWAVGKSYVLINNQKLTFKKKTFAFQIHDWVSFVVSTDVMHEILAVLALHSFAIVQSSSFFLYQEVKLTSKIAKMFKCFLTIAL